MYQALYRKYRPQRFRDVTGQEHITETLARQIMTDRLSHAYLFVGTRGTGKTTCAKILSKAVNCLSPEDGDPCNKCKACVGIDDGSILDVLELDAASNNGVENVRALRDEAIYSPAAVKKRVYIVDEVHMLTGAAFNALLKILEEPPEHILFILATTELHKVPETIQSRCQRFSFKRLTQSSIVSRLEFICDKEGLKLDSAAGKKLAALADGAMRDAVSLLDQCASDVEINLKKIDETLGLVANENLVALIETINSRDIKSALLLLDVQYREGKDMAALLSELAAAVRDLLVFKLSGDTSLLSGSLSVDDLLNIVNKISSERLLFNLEILKNSFQKLSDSANKKLLVEMCLIQLIDEKSSTHVNALLSRIKELESNLSAILQSSITYNEAGKQNPAEIEISQCTQKVESECYPPDGLADDGVPPWEESHNIEVSETVSAAMEVKEENINLKPITSDKSDNLGEVILKQIKEPPVRVLLGDTNKVSLKEDGGVLTITAADAFAAGMIENEYMEILKNAANIALGRNVKIVVQSGSIEIKTEKRSKLESLSAFEIVNYE